jgi:FO synthase subunit 1
VAREELAALGFETTVDYLVHVASVVLDETGLLPHANPGVLTVDELTALRRVSVSQGIMLESISDRLSARGGPHFGSPDKHPAARLETLRLAGELAIPFTTGILIGIGETRLERIEALLAIRDLHDRYGHIQEVIVQNFCPKPGTLMAGCRPVDTDEMCTIIRMAKDLLPDDIAVQVAPNLADVRELVRCGADDLGGISPLTIDHVNPEHPWPELERLQEIAGDVHLQERLCIYPRFIGKGWYQPGLEPLIRRLEQHLQEEERA